VPIAAGRHTKQIDKRRASRGLLEIAGHRLGPGQRQDRLIDERATPAMPSRNWAVAVPRHSLARQSPASTASRAASGIFILAARTTARANNSMRSGESAMHSASLLDTTPAFPSETASIRFLAPPFTLRPPGHPWPCRLFFCAASCRAPILMLVAIPKESAAA
jgi:hypothetical protein